jgi:hypothetical protein
MLEKESEQHISRQPTKPAANYFPLDEPIAVERFKTGPIWVIDKGNLNEGKTLIPVYNQ